MANWRDDYLASLQEAERNNPVNKDLVEACKRKPTSLPRITPHITSQDMAWHHVTSHCTTSRFVRMTRHPADVKEDAGRKTNHSLATPKPCETKQGRKKNHP